MSYDGIDLGGCTKCEKLDDGTCDECVAAIRQKLETVTRERDDARGSTELLLKEVDSLAQKIERLQQELSDRTAGRDALSEALHCRDLQVRELESWKEDMIGRLEHYSGDLWPEEVKAAAKSLLQDFAKKRLSLNDPQPIEGCKCCGSRLVAIRGKVPKTPDREICPTCAQEKLEDLQKRMSPDYGKCYQAKPEQKG